MPNNDLKPISDMKVIVYGGCGGLGRAIVQHFKSAGFMVVSGYHLTLI